MLGRGYGYPFFARHDLAHRLTKAKHDRWEQQTKEGSMWLATVLVVLAIIIFACVVFYFAVTKKE